MSNAFFIYLISGCFSFTLFPGCRTTIHLGQRVPKKKVQEDAKSVIVELRHQRSRKEHLLHEEYNTEHEVSAIPDELRTAVWGEGSQSEIQSCQIVYLFLAEAMGWKHGIAAMPVQTPTCPSQPAHRRRAETNPQHAAPEPGSGHH